MTRHFDPVILAGRSTSDLRIIPHFGLCLLQQGSRSLDRGKRRSLPVHLTEKF